jgi:hypothetical protein
MRGYGLLWGRIEIAESFRLCSQQLNGRRDVRCLRRNSDPERLSPIKMVGKLTDHVRKTRERLDGRIPIHCVDFGKITAANGYRIKRDPALSFDKLNWESARGKDQCKQRVRIQRNGFEQIR